MYGDMGGYEFECGVGGLGKDGRWALGDADGNGGVPMFGPTALRAGDPKGCALATGVPPGILPVVRPVAPRLDVLVEAIGLVRLGDERTGELRTGDWRTGEAADSSLSELSGLAMYRPGTTLPRRRAPCGRLRREPASTGVEGPAPVDTFSVGGGMPDIAASLIRRGCRKVELGPGARWQ